MERKLAAWVGNEQYGQGKGSMGEGNRQYGEGMSSLERCTFVLKITPDCIENKNDRDDHDDSE